MDVAQYRTLLDAVDEEQDFGAWAGAPALAASTVDMKNTSGKPVWVSVTAGTVTVIKINGKTTGATTGQFRVPKNGTLNITYSVAPTVKWYFQ